MYRALVILPGLFLDLNTLMKHLVSLVQPNFQQGPSWLNIFFLPYSVSCVWAFAQSHTDIDAKYKLDKIVWDRRDIDQLAQQLATNRLVLFSTYVWNRNYNYALARKIKKINPDVVTLFGGPEPSMSDPDFFVKHPYIDILVKREGELVVTDLLRNLDNDINNVPGLIINRQGKRHDTGEAGRINNLDDLPSPYLNGMFDEIMQENPHVTWNLTLETNRGCPYQCTFCDWGSLTYSKIKQFSLNRVFAELDWAEKHVTGIYFADANFGIFVERDQQIVNKLIQCHERNPKISYVYINWAKNQKNDVIGMVQQLSRYPGLLSNGLTVSTQSMTPTVLDVIKRSNLEQHKIREIYDIARSRRVSAYTELILGLPTETKESFQNSVFELLELGVHNGVEINQAQLFSNAEMYTVQREMYDIKTVEISDYLTMYQNPHDALLETVSVVTSTDTMSFDDNIDANLWVSFMQAFHFHGFTTQISRFLNRYRKESYKDFYHKLYMHITADKCMSDIIATQRNQIASWFTHGYLPEPAIKEINFNGMNLPGGITVQIHSLDLIDHVFDLLSKFLDCYELSNDLKDQLIAYQKNVTITYDKAVDDQLAQCTYNYDFSGYLENQTQLERQCCVEFFLKPIQKNLSRTQFLDNIFFKRRQRFGMLGSTVRHLDV